MKTDECISNVVMATEPEYEPCRCILNRLESTDKIGWETNQNAYSQNLLQWAITDSRE